MQKRSSIKIDTLYIRRFSRRVVGLFTITMLLLLLCGVVLAYALTARAETSGPISKHTSTMRTSSPSSPITWITPQIATPVAKPTLPVLSINPQNVATPAPGGNVSATPTLVASTPQAVQTGVFPLSAGGPPPVSGSILHPTNIARTVIAGTLVSAYAGSLARQPQQGVLCVLRENLMSGQFDVQLYQSPRLAGPLTITAIHNTLLTIVDQKGLGTFDLNTNQFQW